MHKKNTFLSHCREWLEEGVCVKVLKLGVEFTLLRYSDDEPLFQEENEELSSHILDTIFYLNPRLSNS